MLSKLACQVYQVPTLQPPIVVRICFMTVPSLLRTTISAASPIRSSSCTSKEMVPSALGDFEAIASDVVGSPALVRISTYMPEVAPATFIVQRRPLQTTFSMVIDKDFVLPC